MDYQHILVASDFHDDCAHVLKKAKQLQMQFNCKMTVVTVVPNIPYYMASGLSSISDVEDQLEIEGRDKINSLLKKLELDAELIIKHGSPKIEISKLSRELKVDLVVIGSHGKHGVQLLLGSTSAGVLHRAKCDVVVVRTSKHARAVSNSE